MTVRKTMPGEDILQADDERNVLGDILGFHIRLAHGAVYRHFMETFNDLGLTQKQVGVMWLLADRPGLAQIDLATQLRMDGATTMTLVRRLQRRGFVVRAPSSVDGRKLCLHLTDAGSAMLDHAKKATALHEEWLKSRFKPKEIERLIDYLKRIHG